MSVAVTVLSVLLGVTFTAAGVAKLVGVSAMRASAEHLGYSYSAFRAVGLLELAGGLGVSAGLVFPSLSVAAAAGLVVLTIGATISHLRAKDSFKVAVAPIMFCIMAAVTGTLQALTVS